MSKIRDAMAAINWDDERSMLLHMSAWLAKWELSKAEREGLPDREYLELLYRLGFKGVCATVRADIRAALADEPPQQ